MLSTTSRKSLSICLGIFLVLAGCGGDGGSGNSGSSGSECPSCSAKTTDTSFGPFKFDAAGNDSTARRFVAECGFVVSGGHNGGFGDTLQVIGCDGGIELVWAFEEFSAYRVSTGWRGQTNRGVKIGQTCADVFARDPRLGATCQSSILFVDGTTRIRAEFGTDGILDELIVGQYFRR